MDPDDELWSAVGDPTRRRMLDLLLAQGEGTATTLSDRLPITRQAVSKHLAVLDRVGLVRGTPSGRERRYTVDEDRLARAVEQLTGVGAAWDRRLRRIKQIAEAVHRMQLLNPQPEQERREMPDDDWHRHTQPEGESP